MNIEGKALLSIEEAAHTLGLANSTIRAILASGEIGSVKVGKRRLVPADAVIAYINSLKQQAGISPAPAMEGV